MCTARTGYNGPTVRPSGTYDILRNLLRLEKVPMHAKKEGAVGVS